MMSVFWHRILSWKMESSTRKEVRRKLDGFVPPRVTQRTGKLWTKGWEELGRWS